MFVLFAVLLASCQAQVSWSKVNPTLTTTLIAGVEYSSSAQIYVMLANPPVQGQGPLVFTSAAPQQGDAAAWHAVALFEGQQAGPPYGLTFLDSTKTFFIFDGNNNTWSSTDGRGWVWSQAQTAINPQFLAVNGSSVASVTALGPVFSTDGVSWTLSVVGAASGQMGGGIGYAGGQFVYWGFFWAPHLTTLYLSPDGVSWRGVNLTVDHRYINPTCTVLPGGTEQAIALHVEEQMMGRTNTLIQFWYSDDAGTSWSQMFASSVPTNLETTSYIAPDDAYVRVDRFPSGNISVSVDNGASWAPYVSPSSSVSHVAWVGDYAFAFGLNGYIAVTGDFATGPWASVFEGIAGVNPVMGAYQDTLALSVVDPFGNTTGTYFSKDGAAWARVAGPAQGFFAVGATFYLYNGNTYQWTSDMTTFSSGALPAGATSMGYGGGMFWYTDSKTNHAGKNQARVYAAHSASGPWSLVLTHYSGDVAPEVEVAYANGVFVVCALGGSGLWVGTNLANLTAADSGGLVSVMAAGGIGFFGHTFNDFAIMFSTDGVSWSVSNLPFTEPKISTATTNSVFWAAGANGGTASSRDGINWWAQGNAGTTALAAISVTGFAVAASTNDLFVYAASI